MKTPPRRFRTKDYQLCYTGILVTPEERKLIRRAIKDHPEFGNVVGAILAPAALLKLLGKDCPQLLEAKLAEEARQDAAVRRCTADLNWELYGVAG